MTNKPIVFFWLCVFFIVSNTFASTDTVQKKETIDFYWYPISAISRQIDDNLEYDIANKFIEYINKTHQTTYEINWIETDSFHDVLKSVEEHPIGAFGAAHISITEERKSKINFTPTHFPDVYVLVSNINTIEAQTESQFRELFKGKTMVTVENTTAHDATIKLEKDLGMEFEKEFVQNGVELLNRVSQSTDNVGYISLPAFLEYLNENSNIRRQYFHAEKLEGLAFVYTKNGKWEQLANEYFSSPQFYQDKDELIKNRYGRDIFLTINKINKSAEIGPYEEIIIANQEKELQYKKLLKAAERQKESSYIILMLIIIMMLAILGLILLIIRNQLHRKNTKTLEENQITIEDTNNKLLKLNKRKDEILGVLAHDLRTPIFQIKSITEVLELDNISPDQQKVFHKHINQSCDRMSDMISKILNMEAIEAGDLTIQIESVNVSEIITKTCSQNELHALQKSIQIETNIHENLFAKADQLHLYQIIENLVSNALKFSLPNTIVKIGGELLEDRVQITVSDQGPGISQEDSTKIYEKYEKLRARPTAGEQSVGLGLSIAKKLTEMMNGQLHFISNVGTGTTFYLTLPAA